MSMKSISNMVSPGSGPIPTPRTDPETSDANKRLAQMKEARRREDKRRDHAMQAQLRTHAAREALEEAKTEDEAAELGRHLFRVCRAFEAKLAEAHELWPEDLGKVCTGDMSAAELYAHELMTGIDELKGEDR